MVNLMGLNYQGTKYLKSVNDLDQLPADQGAEVAFIGRSNAGKSSALNTITGIKGLARTSKTPGRTQMINFFSVDNPHRLVDLPGYGYAKVPRNVQERWGNNINEYLQTRQSLQGLILIMDIRHPLKEMDEQLIDWAVQCNLLLHVLLTKSDKLSRNNVKNTLESVTDALAVYGDTVTVQVFSSNDKTGLDEAIGVLNDWLT
jgi:GTP-binding protein